MLIHPLTTEKTTRLLSGRQYTFRVDPRENKIEIAKEIQRLYKASVLHVRICWTKDKKRRLGRIEGVKPGFKKAIITLQKGQTIEL